MSALLLKYKKKLEFFFFIYLLIFSFFFSLTCQSSIEDFNKKEQEFFLCNQKKEYINYAFFVSSKKYVVFSCWLEIMTHGLGNKEWSRYHVNLHLRWNWDRLQPKTIITETTTDRLLWKVGVDTEWIRTAILG